MTRLDDPAHALAWPMRGAARRPDGQVLCRLGQAEGALQAPRVPESPAIGRAPSPLVRASVPVGRGQDLGPAGPAGAAVTSEEDLERVALLGHNR
jgi:hypothetical protein